MGVYSHGVASVVIAVVIAAAAVVLSLATDGDVAKPSIYGQAQPWL